ncbi:MAG TPA: BON domain-containing protein [Candidatus Angelobacter sp.]|nr:BON domain-containing protein [Candidatus Angelobacter sp.]
MNTIRRYFWVALVSLALLAVGCSRSGFGGRSDSQIQADVQKKVNADSNVASKVVIDANNGVVTLSGNVGNDMERNAAANDAAQVDGVTKVINNLQVAPTSAMNTPPPQPAMDNSQPPAMEQSRASARTRRRPSPSSYSNRGNDSGLRTTVPNDTSSSNNGSGNTNSNDTANNYQPSPSTPSAPAAPARITIPAGTGLTIRLNEELSSEKAQVGDVFHGSISTPVTIDNETVIPTSADVEGRVVEVKSAGRFAGQSVLTIELTRLLMNGKSYNLQSDRWSKSGNGRGKSTAAKIGGGAAAGAILGGIFGGGKGAAIGAAAGAGAGTGVSAINKGQQIVLKPETLLNFQMENSITVTPGTSRQSM